MKASSKRIFFDTSIISLFSINSESNRLSLWEFIPYFVSLYYLQDYIIIDSTLAKCRINRLYLNFWKLTNIFSDFILTYTSLNIIILFFIFIECRKKFYLSHHLWLDIFEHFDQLVSIIPPFFYLVSLVNSYSPLLNYTWESLYSSSSGCLFIV